MKLVPVFENTDFIKSNFFTHYVAFEDRKYRKMGMSDSENTMFLCSDFSGPVLY